MKWWEHLVPRRWRLDPPAVPSGEGQVDRAREISAWADVVESRAGAVEEHARWQRDRNHFRDRMAVAFTGRGGS